MTDQYERAVSIYEAADALNRKSAARKLRESFPKWKEQGVKRITVHYAGSDDSGQVQYVEFDRTGRKGKLNEEELEAAFTLAPDGFEIGNGGVGDVILDVERGTITVRHADYVTDTEDREPVEY
jgi:hypothetical protein